MRRFQPIILSSVLVLSITFGQPNAAWGKNDTSDPNAAIRKLQSVPRAPKAPTGPPEVPGAKALSDLEALQKKNNQLSVMHFTQLIQKNAKDSAAYTERGKAYSGLRDYEKAVSDLNKAIKLNPKQTEAYSNRAVVRFMKEDYAGSWEDVHKVQALGGKMWPSFLEALQSSSDRKS